jgi:hypothetical protein
MFSSFASLKHLIKIREISIDNFTFKLHYRLTELLLVVGSVMITLYQYWGQPISCRTTDGEATQSILDFCWISSTFTLPNLTEGRIGKDFIYPGVGGHTGEDEVKYHTYYQWVSIVLLAQGEFPLPVQRHLIVEKRSHECETKHIFQEKKFNSQHYTGAANNLHFYSFKLAALLQFHLKIQFH